MKLTLVPLAGLAVVLSLAACQAETATRADDTPSTGAAEDEVAAPELTADQANARAFEAAWEAAAPVTASDPRLADDEDGRWPEPLRGQFEFRSAELVQLSSDLYALVSSGFVEGAGASTQGVLAFHYLTRTEDGFRKVGAEPLFIAGGRSGQAPTFTVRRDLMPAPVVLIDTRTERNGGACTQAQIVELAPSQPLLRATGIPMAFETGDASRSWQGQPQPGRPGRDFGIQYSGASSGHADWVLTDAGTYRASGQPRLSGC